MKRSPRCAYCGAAIDQAATGRPREFCDDGCRKAASRARKSSDACLQSATVDSADLDLLLGRTATRPEDRLRRWYAVQRWSVSEAFSLKRSLVPSLAWRPEEVGRDLEATLDRNFTDLERKRRA